MITRGEHKTAVAGYAGSRRYARAALLFVTLAVLCVAAAPTTAGNEVDGVAGDEDATGAPDLCGTPKDLPLIGTKGVITTPNFPGPFTVPIKCEWVIQADAAAIETTIEVYFTQLFVTDGLTITEYSQYPPDFGFVTVREVFNKSHITQYGQSMVSTLPYLVIRFQLDRLQGNHIRVHDDLMDVYGFNITYEMRPAGNERSDVCSLYQCSYSGNCLGNADLTEYKCSCFPGFSGEDCGYGPICKLNNTDSCENGGVCRHVGRSIAICNCPAGFTGGKCEVPVVNVTAECGSSSICIQQCNINKDVVDTTNDSPCPCNLYKNHSTPIDSVRYHAAIKLVNISAIVNENLNEHLQLKILKYFRKHLKPATSHEPYDLRITSILPKTGDVHFEFYSRKSDQKIVQDLLNHMIANGSLGTVPLVKTALSFQQEPSLWLNKMDVNKNRDSIPEGEPFIISCIAQGPPDMQFKWFKDGIPVNTSISTRNIWSKIKKTDKPDYRTSVLVIEHADILDSGKFTCQVSDNSHQQCQSIALTVIPLPEVIMKPSITVKPGDNVTIMCFLKNEFTKFGNTWLDSDMRLVKIDKNVYWEDLHRGGSVLYVKNITSSAEYRCEASNRAGRRNATVYVDVLNTNVMAHCMADGVWPLTGAGKSASSECPKNRSTSYASRTCVLTAANRTEWQKADYSRCAPDDLNKITMNFRKKTLGYDKVNVTAAKTLSSLYSDLHSTAKWYPGEGEPVIDFLVSVTSYLLKSSDLDDLDQASISFDNILSMLMENDSVVNEKKIVQLLDMIETWTLLKAFYLFTNKGTKQFTNQIENIHVASASEVVITHSRNITHRFYDKQTIRPSQQPKVIVSMCDVQIDKWINKSFNVGVTTFRNLSEFFPRKYFINKSKDGEIEYSVMTPLVSVSVAQDGQRIRKHWPTIVTELEFDLTLPWLVNGTWNVTCVTMARLTDHQWDMSSCRVVNVWSPSSNVTRCHCPSAGLFTVLARVVPLDEGGQSTSKQDVIIVFGCACCLVQSAMSLMLLVIQWVKHPTCIVYLKIQLCFAIIIQMCMFLYATKNNDYGYFSLYLQIVTIVEITSHLSQLLIVYTEIISFPQFSNIKLPIIGVATTAPVLFVLSIMLSLNIIGAKPIRPWWSWENSAFIYIYIIIFILLMIMYLSVLAMTVPKLKFIKQKLQRNTPTSMKKRMGLIIRSVAILLTVIVTTVSSILHIIYMEDFSKYFFSSSCAIQGFVVLYCYVLHSEDPFDLRTVYRPKSSPQQSSDDIHSDSAGSPLNRFSKNTMDYEIKQSIKSDILEITDNPQEYFITQEKPVSIVSNLTSSLKKLDSNTEPKKSVTFRHDLITGCHEKSDGHDTDSGCGDYCGSGEKSCCSYRNNSRSPLLETTAIDSADMVLVDDWQSVDFADASQPTSMAPLPAGSDTSIRCVVQPPPDMLATHVCVEVGLVKQHATTADGSPTIVVCSVDVEPCRQPHMLFMSGVTDKSSTMAPEPGTDDGSGGDSNDDDVLDRISQDLDYLLNRKNVGDSNEVESDGDGDADRNQKKKAKDLTLP